MATVYTENNMTTMVRPYHRLATPLDRVEVAQNKVLLYTSDTGVTLHTGTSLERLRGVQHVTQFPEAMLTVRQLPMQPERFVGASLDFSSGASQEFIISGGRDSSTILTIPLDGIRNKAFTARITAQRPAWEGARFVQITRDVSGNDRVSLLDGSMIDLGESIYIESNYAPTVTIPGASTLPQLQIELPVNPHGFGDLEFERN